MLLSIFPQAVQLQTKRSLFVAYLGWFFFERVCVESRNFQLTTIPIGTVMLEPRSLNPESKQ